MDDAVNSEARRCPCRSCEIRRKTKSNATPIDRNSTPVVDILEQRGRTHGNFAAVSKIAQTIKGTYATADGLSPEQRESLDMMATKISRIVAGDPNSIDHWLDIEGYARLVRNTLEKDNG